MPTVHLCRRLFTNFSDCLALWLNLHCLVVDIVAVTISMYFTAGLCYYIRGIFQDTSFSQLISASPDYKQRRLESVSFVSWFDWTRLLENDAVPWCSFLGFPVLASSRPRDGWEHVALILLRKVDAHDSWHSQLRFSKGLKELGYPTLLHSPQLFENPSLNQ